MRSPEQKFPETRSGRVVPVEFVFSPHSEQHIENVAFFEGRVEAAIKGYTGKILVVTENALGTQFGSIAVRLAIEAGYKPSVAAASLHLLPERQNTDPVNLMATPNETAEYLQKQPKYIQAQFGVMDRLTEKHKGRIHWLVEGSTTFEQADEIEKQNNESNEDTQQAYVLTEQGQFDNALPYFKRGVNVAADLSYSRERNLVRVINNHVQRFPEITGVVGQIGSLHTPIVHQLSKMGYPARMNFSDKGILPYESVEGYLFSPRDALARKLVMFPGIELTDEEYLRFLIGDTIYQVLASFPIEAHGFTRQESISHCWGFINQLETIDDIRKLQGFIRRENDFIVAVEIYNSGRE